MLASQAFEGEPDLKELRFEAMDKDKRYVVHDVITQYPNLVSASVGDMEDRHVVVYRRGHQPADVEVHVTKEQLRSSGSSRPQAKSGAGSLDNKLVDFSTMHKLQVSLEEF